MLDLGYLILQIDTFARQAILFVTNNSRVGGILLVKSRGKLDKKLFKKVFKLSQKYIICDRDGGGGIRH